MFNVFLRIIAIAVSPGNKKVDLISKNNMYWNIMQYVEFRYKYYFDLNRNITYIIYDYNISYLFLYYRNTTDLNYEFYNQVHIIHCTTRERFKQILQEFEVGFQNTSAEEIKIVSYI